MATPSQNNVSHASHWPPLDVIGSIMGIKGERMKGGRVKGERCKDDPGVLLLGFGCASASTGASRWPVAEARHASQKAGSMHHPTV